MTVSYTHLDVYKRQELYRIGTGPSSSHTMGPRKAAEIFLDAREATLFHRGGVHTNRPREWQLQRYYRQFEVINRLCGACGREPIRC